ncbi:hypothetical protein [Mucilaginibacter sp. OK283]|jgi:hypothetical protein|uniref:hypothetical protein n=1 Tax=Mucilaginibacter sp. OK283 TaxID=1881049 RepID=UPI0008AE7F6F|nr:hypothetical protein [Mucilaginibacter sp. OK283]SEO98115.1 hypothetical protein SAMN05428947_105328 [Mucilaginibacter sp. OK283]
MKKLTLLTLLVASTGVLSSAVLISQKKVEQPQAAGFIKVDSGFKKDLANAD